MKEVANLACLFVLLYCITANFYNSGEKFFLLLMTENKIKVCKAFYIYFLYKVNCFHPDDQTVKILTEYPLEDNRLPNMAKKPSDAKNTSKIAKNVIKSERGAHFQSIRNILQRFVTRMERYKNLDYSSSDNRHVDIRVILEEKFISKKLLSVSHSVERQTWSDFKRVSALIEMKLNAKKIAIENKLLNLIKKLLKKTNRVLLQAQGNERNYRAMKLFLKKLQNQQHKILSRFQNDVENNEHLDENVKYSIYKIISVVQVPKKSV